MSFFSKLFGQNKYIDCPRCLNEISINVKQLESNSTVNCEECKFDIPLKYVRKFNDAYPAFIQLFGWSQVGKTTFLDVLRLILYHHPLWPQFTCDPITKLDFDHKAILLDQRLNGERPNSTIARDRDQNNPYIMLLNDMHRWGSRFMVMMDHAGEQFQGFDVPEGEIPFLQHCPTTIMLYSLTEEKAGKRIDDLMTTYIGSLERYGVDFKKSPRNLIVVFAKGDRITNLPPNLAEYLNSDETWAYLEQLDRPPYLQNASLSEYIEIMGRVSDSIEKWFHNNIAGAQQFNAMAIRNNIETRFSIISAQGQEFNEFTSAAQMNPKRVLDPFFWALEFQSK